ncbi:hypothetical protein A2U01_0046652, partial [Trifolium medium]|nr:hypothetical protein [Trifolium medium]
SGLTPFEVIYGKPPPVVPSYIPGTSSVDASDVVLSSREEILALLLGPVAYKLALPAYSKIHNVFHCSKLKPHIGEPPKDSDVLPVDCIDNHPLISPLAVIGDRAVEIDGVMTRQVLVQWK